MTLSRKDFFKQGLFSIGEALFKAGWATSETLDSHSSQTDDGENVSAPVSDENTVASADNRHCLAKNCGCFSCVERCEAGAIMLFPGKGIRINEELCTGCGTCAYICPVTPKAVRMQPRTGTTEQTPSAVNAEQPQKGETPC